MRGDLKKHIESSAYLVYRRYRGYVEAADVRQEMWLWATAKEKQIEDLPVPTLRWRLRDVGERFARQEKAQKSGYHPDDEVFYGLRAIRAVLHDVVTDEPVVLRGVDEADKPAARRAGASLPMEYETAIADLRDAFSALPELLQTELRKEARGDVGADPEMVTKALRRIQRALGGRKPQVDL